MGVLGVLPLHGHATQFFPYRQENSRPRTKFWRLYPHCSGLWIQSISHNHAKLWASLHAAFHVQLNLPNGRASLGGQYVHTHPSPFTCGRNVQGQCTRLSFQSCLLQIFWSSTSFYHHRKLSPSPPPEDPEILVQSKRNLYSQSSHKNNLYAWEERRRRWGGEKAKEQ